MKVSLVHTLTDLQGESREAALQNSMSQWVKQHKIKAHCSLQETGMRTNKMKVMTMLLHDSLA